MSFSYDPATVSVNKIHEVRFLTGQTEKTTSQIEDEEIQYWLTKNNEEIDPTVQDVLKSLLKKAAHCYDKTTGEVSESLSQWYEHLQDLINDPPPDSIDLSFSTPIGLHRGGLYSEEFALRNADQTVYQGFQACDNNPWDIGLDPVNGVAVTDIQDSGQTEASDQNLDETP